VVKVNPYGEKDSNSGKIGALNVEKGASREKQIAERKQLLGNTKKKTPG